MTSLAFKDINPGAPTHVLVIPKRHVASAQDLTAADGDLLGEIFATMAKIAGEAGSGGRAPDRYEHRPGRRAERPPPAFPPSRRAVRCRGRPDDRRRPTPGLAEVK